MLQEQLRRVGIALDIRSYEWGTFFSDIRKGNFQLYTLTWVGVTDPDIYHYIFHSGNVPPHGANRGRYRNADVDRLLERGRTAYAPKTRREVYGQVQEILGRDLPYVNLWHATNVAVLNQRVRGFVLYPDEDMISLKDVRLAVNGAPGRP